VLLEAVAVAEVLASGVRIGHGRPIELGRVRAVRRPIGRGRLDGASGRGARVVRSQAERASLAPAGEPFLEARVRRANRRDDGGLRSGRAARGRAEAAVKKGVFGFPLERLDMEAN